MKDPKTRLSCICLAAGLSSRMGADHKLLKACGDKTVIETVVDDLLKFPFAEIVVVTGARASEVEGLLTSYPLRIVRNPEYGKGLHRSIRAGVETLGEADAFVLVLGDQPFQLLDRIECITRYPYDSSSLVRSVVKGKPGHPVLIGSDYIAEILAHEDFDGGAAYLFQEHAHRSVEQKESALWDLDTPDDFILHAEALKAQSSSSALG